MMAQGRRLFYGPDLPGCLYGLRTPAQPHARFGVLCVQPLFGDYIQYHRAFFNLGERLAMSGIASLRWDHAGTGDSPGDLLSITLDDWIDGVAEAARVLAVATRLHEVCIVSARFGAALAVQAADRIPGVIGFAGWDPIFDGGLWMREARETHRRVMARWIDEAAEEQPTPDVYDLLGFEIPSALFKAIASFRVAPEAFGPDLDIALVGTRRTVEAVRFPAGYDRVRRRVVTYPGSWGDPADGIFDVLTPPEALNEITAFVERLA